MSHSTGDYPSEKKSMAPEYSATDPSYPTAAPTYPTGAPTYPNNAPYPTSDQAGTAGAPIYYPTTAPAYTVDSTYTGQPLPAQVVMMPTMADPPKDYLILSIISTIFCCFWIGLAAIWRSTKVRDAVRDGNRPAAEEASRQARCLNITAIIFGIITIGLVIVVYAVYFTKISSTYSSIYDDNYYK